MPNDGHYGVWSDRGDVFVLLGASVRLLDGVGFVEQAQERVIASTGVTHLRYRVVR